DLREEVILRDGPICAHCKKEFNPWEVQVDHIKARARFKNPEDADRMDNMDSSALNRGHEHQRSMRRWNTRDGRPRCFGGAQRGSGTCNDSSSGIVQPWSVIPAAMAGVVLWPAWRLS